MLLPAIGGCLAVIGVIICVLALTKSKKKKDTTIEEEKKED